MNFEFILYIFDTVSFINTKNIYLCNMKEYMLTKIDFLGLNLKKINYAFKVENTNISPKFNKIIIHHTGNPRTIQKIIDLHVNKNHWTSIGYHFLIGKNGQIYYSRDLSNPGAHTYGFNKEAIGIGFFGNFTKVEPTEKQIESGKKLIFALKEKFKIKEVIGHNQAIYSLLEKEFVEAKLPKFDLNEIDSDFKYYEKIKEIENKIKKKYSDKEADNLLKRLKSCPGINMYKYLEEFNKIK